MDSVWYMGRSEECKECIIAEAFAAPHHISLVYLRVSVIAYGQFCVSSDSTCAGSCSILICCVPLNFQGILQCQGNLLGPWVQCSSKVQGELEPRDNAHPKVSDRNQWMNSSVSNSACGNLERDSQKIIIRIIKSQLPIAFVPSLLSKISSSKSYLPPSPWTLLESKCSRSVFSVLMWIGIHQEDEFER